MTKYLFDTNVFMDIQSTEDLSLFSDGEWLYAKATIDELEKIKSSRFYSDEKKFKARKAVDLLLREHTMFKCLNNDYTFIQELYDCSPDEIIISTAMFHNATLVTSDKSMILVARDIYEYENVRKFYYEKDDYKGYLRITLDEFSNNEVPHLLLNQYLVVEGETEGFVYVCDDEKEQKLSLVNSDIAFYSAMFNRTQPLDETQIIAMDSLQRTQLTMLKGKAGTGKSFLALSYLFQELQRSHIDKIYIFVNPVKAYDTQELGYYPGNKDEKLLQSQIGNFLVSHLGSMDEVTRLINDEELVILPMSDIRGVDLSIPCGLYITECQNASISLMKLCLTRVGDECKVILDGDYMTQLDKAAFGGNNNGMKRVSEVFRGEDIYSEIELGYVQRSRIAEICERM